MHTILQCETETTEIGLYGILGVSVEVICSHEVHEILEIVPTAEVNSFDVFYRTLSLSLSVQ